MLPELESYSLFLADPRSHPPGAPRNTLRATGISPRDLQVRHTCGARVCSATRGAHRRVDGGPIRGTCAAASRQLLVREPLRRRPAAARRGQPVRSGRCASEYCEPVWAAPPTAGSNGPADAGEPFRPADADAAAVPVRGAAAAAGAARNAQAPRAKSAVSRLVAPRACGRCLSSRPSGRLRSRRSRRRSVPPRGARTRDPPSPHPTRPL